MQFAGGSRKNNSVSSSEALETLGKEFHKFKAPKAKFKGEIFLAIYFRLFAFNGKLYELRNALKKLFASTFFMSPV